MSVGCRAKEFHKLQPFLEFFSTTAYAQAAQTAQAPFSVRDLAIGLESPDAIVRRKTREHLANLDQATALPWIDEVLKDPKSSYRLKLGVIVALNNMPKLSKESLEPSTISAIQSAVGHPDATLRNEAVNFLNRYNLVPVIVWEHFDYRGKSQAYAEGRYRANRNEFGNLPNDSASALHVGIGFQVKLCEHEGNGTGAPRCQSFPTGWHQLTNQDLADRVSYIEVKKK